jgi:hypothetical protein
MVHDLAPLAGVTSSCEMMEATNLRSAAVSPDASGDGDGQPVASTTPGEATQGANGVAVQTAVAALKAQMGLPAAGALPGDGVPIQSSGKATQKNAVDAAKNAGLANVTDLGKSKTAETVGATSDGSSHGAQSGNSGDSSSQSNGQPAQHFQGDFGQSPAVALKVFDASAAQVQAVPVQGAAHDAAGTPGTPGGSDVSHQSLQPGSSAASQPEADEVVGSSGINAATVIQAMGGTEMRVGMHSSEFGNISIRTSVSQQQMLTQISLDHSDLSQAIAAHVSAVQTKLGSDFGLNASIQVNHQGASMSGESGSPSQREQRAFAPSVRGQIGAVAAEPDIGTSAGALVGASDGYRLDIRA